MALVSVIKWNDDRQKHQRLPNKINKTHPSPETPNNSYTVRKVNNIKQRRHESKLPSTFPCKIHIHNASEIHQRPSSAAKRWNL